MPPLREVIARHGLDARKSLGQHFLLDPNLTRRIARLAGELGGRHVVEVGPGPGGLTRALLETDAAKVLAVELDRRAIGAMRELQAAYPERLGVLEADATRLDLAGADVPAPRQLAANLPYNVATPLLIGWLRQAASLGADDADVPARGRRAVCAAPDTPGVRAAERAGAVDLRTALLLRLPPAAFTPPPKVWSAVVGLIPHAEQPPPALLRTMERLTAAAFGQRRKMLRGSLRALGGEALLERAGHRAGAAGGDADDRRVGPARAAALGAIQCQTGRAYPVRNGSVSRRCSSSAKRSVMPAM